MRPGFTLSKMIAEGVKNNPNAELVLMEKHGLVVWGDTAKESYERTIAVINEAEQYMNERVNESTIFGGQKYDALSVEERRSILAKVMPIIRGAVSDEKKMLLSYDDTDEVLQFVNSYNARELSQVGAACPDHLVHTKRSPLYIDWDPQTKNVDGLIEVLNLVLKTLKMSIKLTLNVTNTKETKCLNLHLALF
ncbi:class II aldolase/adducin family protein [Bacillus pacificus]